MSSIRKPQNSPESSTFTASNDSWDVLAETKTMSDPGRVPLDPSHELTGVPFRAAIMPQSVPEALKLTEPSTPVHSAVAILLTDEMKLADQVNQPLWDHIRDAIALLELAQP